MDLLTGAQSPYHEIYASLHALREAFHREGRISDANAKLDETVKLLTIHYGYYNGIVDADTYNSLNKRSTFSIFALNSTFDSVANSKMFSRKGMGSIFGAQPATVFVDGDEPIAYELFRVAGRVFRAQNNDNHSLDILNEAFGHHVRDNFRSHVEDAQYMTPPEVVHFMVKLALHHLNLPENAFNMIVADPSCGVGSFLTTWRTIFKKHYGTDEAQKVRCLGQDKTDRMVRLSAINSLFSDNGGDDVFLGNSLDDSSPMINYNGKVDLILTNPPFGARFSVQHLRATARRSVPFFSGRLSKAKTVDSELLFIDRYLTLLKPGGSCFAVVPDGVISAKGLSAVTRQHLSQEAELICVVELPAVTFAQAGTRTKTAVLGFQKVKPRKSYPVFFGEANDIGFQVSRRKGVAIKRAEGRSDLHELQFAFQSDHMREQHLGEPKGRWCRINPSAKDGWTPRTILFERELIGSASARELVPLSEYTLSPEKRRPVSYGPECYYISVLHVVGDGILDIASVRDYRPVTPGVPVYPGEVLLSRINPRIPRVSVVPELGKNVLCSSEFEIIRAREGVSPYLLAFVLLLPLVQQQIQSFTAGTSASHSRIKPKQVYEVLVPRYSDMSQTSIMEIVNSYEASCKRILSGLVGVDDVRRKVKERGLGVI